MKVLAMAAVWTAVCGAGCANMEYTRAPGSSPYLPSMPAADVADAKPAELAARTPGGSGGSGVVLASTDGAAVELAQAKRVVIYTAGLQVVVSRIEPAIEQVVAIAREAGGYMQEQEARAVVVRVPAAKFEGVLAKLMRIGEVVDKQVKAADVTEEMMDLEIRLDTAMKTRERLLKILEQSGKTEDTLKVEAELARLTETIERIKGRKRYLESQAALSTIRVTFNSPVPQQTQVGRLPFSWVGELGDGVVTGHVAPGVKGGSWFNRGIRMELPKGFVRYFVSEERTEAMNANGVLVKARKHDNYDKGDVKFWGELARKSLVESRSIALTESKEIRFENGAQGMLFVGTRQVGQEEQGYLLVLGVGEEKVVTFEAWGGKDAFARERAGLEGTGKQIGVK